MDNQQNTSPGAGIGMKKVTRRNFVGGSAAAAAAIPLWPVLGGKESELDAAVVPYNPNKRVEACLNYRIQTALAERIAVDVQPDNAMRSGPRILAAPTAKRSCTTLSGFPTKPLYKA